MNIKSTWAGACHCQFINRNCTSQKPDDQEAVSLTRSRRLQVNQVGMQPTSMDNSAFHLSEANKTSTRLFLVKVKAGRDHLCWMAGNIVRVIPHGRWCSAALRWVAL